MRVYKTIWILIGFVVLPGILGSLTYDTLKPDRDNYSQESLSRTIDRFDKAEEAAANAGRGAAMLLLIGALALLLPTIAYRRIDALLFIIPFYGIVFLCMVAWRLASLPERYWSERETGTGSRWVRQAVAPWRDAPRERVQGPRHQSDATDAHTTAVKAVANRADGAVGEPEFRQLRLRCAELERERDALKVSLAMWIRDSAE